MPIELVIFDMDGVLVDSEPVIAAAAFAGLREFGVNAAPEDFREFVGQGEDRYVGGVAEKHGVQYRVEMKRRVYEIYLELVQNRLEVFPATLPTLAALRTAAYRLALASSADRIKVEANLRAAEIAPATFAAICSAETCARRKPAPDLFLWCAERTGVAPERCCVVEDALSGIRAAKAAGMRCIALTTSFSRETLERETPDAICGGIGEVPVALRRIDRAPSA